MAGTISGTCKVWKSGQGYGFLKRDDGAKDIFVHVRDLKASGVTDEPKPGDAFKFDISDGERGPHAVNLSKA